MSVNVVDDSPTRRAAQVASPMVERLARVGYGAKGVLYLAVAAFVALTATGEREHQDEIDSTGVLFFLDEGPLGTLVLAGLTVGLTGHALWRIVQGIVDPDGRATGWVGAFRRLSYVVRGLLHAALVVTAVRLLVDDGARRHGVRDWSAELLHASPPYGAWLVGLAGVAIVAYALDGLHKVWSPRLRRELDLAGLDARIRRSALAVCRLGTTVRASVFLASGVFIVRAALEQDPRHAKGFADALATLQAWRGGPVLLLGVAAGLFAYALQELLKAFRRNIELP